MSRSNERIALAVILVNVASLLAQPPGGMPPPSPPTFMVLMEKSVQTELKMTKDQIQKLTALQTKQMTAMRSTFNLQPQQRMEKMQEMMQEMNGSAEGILKPDQRQRFKQITLQVQGTMAFGQPEVAESLKITEDQHERLKAIHQEMGKKMMPNFQQKPASFQAMQQKMTQAKKAMDEQAMKVLTAEQQSQWTQMIGQPFKGEIRSMPPMGFGPPAGGPGGFPQPPGFQPK